MLNYVSKYIKNIIESLTEEVTIKTVYDRKVKSREKEPVKLLGYSGDVPIILGGFFKLFLPSDKAIIEKYRKL